MSQSPDILLAKWLTGDLSDAEHALLAQSYDLEALKTILDKQEMHVPEIKSANEMWSELQTKREVKHKPLLKDKNSSRPFIWVLGILGLALLGMILLYFFNNRTNTRVKTLYTPKTEVPLIDGSFAILGPHSQLEYNEKKWNTHRLVTLEGQAFFNIEKGAPFKVRTLAGEVEVLGTQFDVWNIHTDYMRVACTEGSVRVTDPNGNARILKASEHVYITEGSIEKVSSESDKLIDWQSNFRNYESTPIKIVFHDLERFYPITFEMENSEQKEVFSGILPINDLAKCVAYLEASLQYESKIDENKIIFKKVK